MKKCPYCAEEIQDNAIKCRHCGEFLNNILANQQGISDKTCADRKKRPRRNSKDANPFIVAIAIIFLIVFIYALLEGQQNGQSQSAINEKVKKESEVANKLTDDEYNNIKLKEQNIAFDSFKFGVDIDDCPRSISYKVGGIKYVVRPLHYDLKIYGAFIYTPYYNNLRYDTNLKKAWKALVKTFSEKYGKADKIYHKLLPPIFMPIRNTIVTHAWHCGKKRIAIVITSKEGNWRKIGAEIIPDYMGTRERGYIVTCYIYEKPTIEKMAEENYEFLIQEGLSCSDSDFFYDKIKNYVD